MEFTYRKLKQALDFLTDEELDQPVQVMPNNPAGEPHVLQPVVAFATVRYFVTSEDGSSEETRSSYDNRHHPEDWVILSDENLFGEDGSVLSELDVDHVDE